MKKLSFLLITLFAQILFSSPEVQADPTGKDSLNITPNGDRPGR